MFDAAKLQRILPLLINYGKDVESWITDFSKTMELYDIMEPRRIFTWAKEAVEEDIQGALNSLVKGRGDSIRYPTLKEIQDTIEEHLHITENDKCSVLKSLKINEDESLKKFNYKYKKLYNKLSLEYRRLISVKDYTNAISSRVFPCSRVMIAECETINEAFKIAEVAEEAEKEISNANQRSKINNNMGTNIMFTQNHTNNNVLLNHPFYENLHSRQLPMNQDGNNTFIGENNWNFRASSWNNNNSRNPNYSNHAVNLRNHMNYYSNNSNNYVNRMPRRNSINGYNNKINYDRYSNNNKINNHYMNFNMMNNTNKMSNNQLLNEGEDNQNNIDLKNINNNMMTNNNKEYNNQMTNGNTINTNNMTQSFSYQNRKKYHSRTENNNVINTLVTKNNNKFNDDNNYHVNCYRCTMEGHRASECPYTFKQLAEMEEQGLINKPLNQ